MLSMILLQVAAGMSLAKVGAAIGAGYWEDRGECHGRYCPPTRADREYSYEYDRDRCFD